MKNSCSKSKSELSKMEAQVYIFICQQTRMIDIHSFLKIPCTILLIWCLLTALAVYGIPLGNPSTNIYSVSIYRTREFTCFPE